jgi:hypothetical protein
MRASFNRDGAPLLEHRGKYRLGVADLRGWVGRTEAWTDDLYVRLAEAFNATLDCLTAPRGLQLSRSIARFRCPPLTLALGAQGSEVNTTASTGGTSR